MKQLAIVCLSLFLTLILTGCPKPVIKYVREPVPPNYIAHVPFPQPEGDTIEGRLQWNLLWEASWMTCNEKLDAIDKWGRGEQ